MLCVLLKSSQCRQLICNCFFCFFCSVLCFIMTMIIIYNCLKSILLQLSLQKLLVCQICQYCIFMLCDQRGRERAANQKAHLSNLGRKRKKKAVEQDSVHKSCSVARECGVSRSQSLQPSPCTVQAWRETDSSSGHGLVCSRSPLSEKSYAVCFEWTAFFFVCSIKTEGKVSQQVA